MGGSSASNPLPTPTGRARPPGCRHRRNAGSAASRDKQHAGRCLFATGERGDLGSGRSKGASRCPIESRKRGAAKSGCHAGFDACSGDLKLPETRRKPPTRNGKLNLGDPSPRTRIGRPWGCCLSSTARVGGNAASSTPIGRVIRRRPASPRTRCCLAREAAGTAWRLLGLAPGWGVCRARRDRPCHCSEREEHQQREAGRDEDVDGPWAHTSRSEPWAGLCRRNM
jgi:hypothetical protein